MNKETCELLSKFILQSAKVTEILKDRLIALEERVKALETANIVKYTGHQK